MNDVQVVEQPPIEHSRWLEIERYLSSRRKQLQDWEATPPHLVGAAIFVAVVIELCLSFSLLGKTGFGREWLSKAVSLGSGLFCVQALFVGATHEAGLLFNKQGSRLTAFTFVNLGLMPLLLFLPIVVLCRMSPGLQQAPYLLLLLLILQVMSNWREAVEVAFELTRLQSAIFMYVVGGSMAMLLGLVLYMSIISSVVDLLQGF